MLKLLHIKWFENHDSYLFLIFAYLQRVLNLFMIFTNTISMDFTSFCIYFYWYCNIMLLGWQECYTVHYLFCMQIRKMNNNFVSAFFSIIQRGGFVSEPAILVKYNDDTSQVWSMEKLDLKLIDMRELYDELKSLDENAKALFSNLRKNLTCSGGKCFYLE